MDLRDYLHFNRITLAEMSRKIGYSAYYLSRVSNFKVRPSERLAKEISLFCKGEVTIEGLRNAKYEDKKL